MENFPSPESRGEQKVDFGELVGLANSADVTVYERLNASNDKQAKAEFLENPELVHPNNQYGNLDETEVRRNFATLEQIDEELENSDLNDKRKRLIRLVTDDYKKKNEFLAANIAYNVAEAPEERLRQ